MLPSPRILVLVAYLLALVASPSPGQVRLVKDSQSTCVVVLANEPTETARYAAEELVRHIQKATGAAIEIVTEASTPAEIWTRVYIGETEAARLNGIDTDRLPRETFVMRSVGNDLFIAGQESDKDPLDQNNPDAGTLFGVYEFLERYLGVRWLWPGELGTFVPQTGTVEIWSVNETIAPALAFRELVWGRTRAALHPDFQLEPADAALGFSAEGARKYAEAVEVLLRRHRMGGGDAEPPTGHTFNGWWEKYGKDHPEWFALRKDGTRGHPDPTYPDVSMCVSNPEFQDFVIEQWNGDEVLRVGPVDRPGRCVCENCRAWDGPQPDPPPWFAERLYLSDRRSEGLFAGSTSDRYARFWKILQEKAERKNPNVLVSASYLYENEFPAPVTGIKLNKNIYGEFVQWLDPHLRYFPMPEEAFDWIKEQWLGWRETGIRMGYRPNYLHDGYVMPHFETRQSGEFFKFAYDHGMEGARFDSLTGQWAVQGLRLYLHLRLMNKPDLEVEEVRKEYFSGFGPSAEAMREYFDYWEDYAFDNNMRLIKLYWDVGWRYRVYAKQAYQAFPLECFTPAEEILQRAVKEAEASANPEFLERVRFIQTGLEHARLAVELSALFEGNEEAPEGNREKAKEKLEDLASFRKAHEASFFSDLLHVTGFWERPHLNVEGLIEK
jgi:hypothetical protein